MKTRIVINTKPVVVTSLSALVLTMVLYWLTGLQSHRSITQNALLSVTTLSFAFFVFVFAGLYLGVKLKDNIGKITDRFNPKKIDVPDVSSPEPIALGDDLAGIILSLLAWIVISIVLLALLWLFGAVLWLSILVVAAMLYWVFFRALRLVFKNSPRCKGRIGLCLWYASAYTALYTGWILGILYLAAYDAVDLT